MTQVTMLGQITTGQVTASDLRAELAKDDNATAYRFAIETTPEYGTAVVFHGTGRVAICTNSYADWADMSEFDGIDDAIDAYLNDFPRFEAAN